MSDRYVRIGTANSFVRLSFHQLPNSSWDGRFIAEVRDGQFWAQAEYRDHPASRYSLDAFAKEVSTLHKTLKGQATFNPLNDQVKLVLSADAFGHIDVSGYLYRYAGFGTHLSFQFQIDQTYLPETLAQLKQLVL